MKKALIIILAVLYASVTSGVMVNIHYCMGRVAAVNYGHAAEEDCKTCGMEKQDGCCHTDHKFVKADDDHLISKNLAASVPSQDLPLTYLNEDIFITRSPDIEDLSYEPPPDPRSNHVCVYNSVFRI